MPPSSLCWLSFWASGTDMLFFDLTTKSCKNNVFFELLMQTLYLFVKSLYMSQKCVLFLMRTRCRLLIFPFLGDDIFGFIGYYQKPLGQLLLCFLALIAVIYNFLKKICK
jgi:hypothetical protein